jgi:uncharacterized SAM-binding protein YcdF (DUF218 family)
MFVRIAGRVCLAAALLSLPYGFLAFDSFSAPPAQSIESVAAAVVFTGAHERIDAGLQLAAAGAAPRLFISGANSRAGIFPGRFAPLFAERNPNIKDLPRLLACCVELGEMADNTAANALETRTWLQQRKIEGPVLLITSRLHMARALALLSATLGQQRIIPYPVEDALNGDPLRERAEEYAKYLATLVLVKLPWIFDAKRLASVSA